MPVVTPNWNIPTPALSDAYNLVGDLATTASAVDDALTVVGTARRGTTAQRIAFAATSQNGMLWQDTDSIKMLWRRDSTVSGNWTPAVTRWTGTTAQMNTFAASAPNGFEWGNTTDNAQYIRTGGVWKKNPFIFTATLTPVVSGGGVTSGWYYAGNSTYTFPAGTFTTTPSVSLYAYGTGFITTSLTARSATSITYAVMRLGAAPASDTRVELQAWIP